MSHLVRKYLKAFAARAGNFSKERKLVVPVTYFLNTKQTQYKVGLEALSERLLKKKKKEERPPGVHSVDCLPSLRHILALVPGVIETGDTYLLAACLSSQHLGAGQEV